MARHEINFQPGAVLHEAVMGGLRANGTNFSVWCRENGVSETAARQATFGQSRGPNGQDILGRLIKAAGPEFVRQVYDTRVLAHAEQLKSGAA